MCCQGCRVECSTLKNSCLVTVTACQGCQKLKVKNTHTAATGSFRTLCRRAAHTHRLQPQRHHHHHHHPPPATTTSQAAGAPEACGSCSWWLGWWCREPVVCDVCVTSLSVCCNGILVYIIAVFESLSSNEKSKRASSHTWYVHSTTTTTHNHHHPPPHEPRPPRATKFRCPCCLAGGGGWGWACGV